MAHILSIQSHVAYGYVGNRVASFALQRLKNEVITVNTVQFSNHTGYGVWKGDVFSVEHLRAVWQGIKERVPLSSIDGLLTGYLGNESVAEFIEQINDELRAHNKHFNYCLDPVFGDVGRNLFVKEELALFFKERFIFKADVITPNHFEMNYLCGTKINDIQSLKTCATLLFEKGLNTILVTSYQGCECQQGEIAMVLLTPTDSWLIKTPKLEFDIAPNGSGDLVSALVLDKVLKGVHHRDLLEQVTSQVYKVFVKTKESKERELQLIQAQDELVNEEIVFSAHQV